MADEYIKREDAINLVHRFHGQIGEDMTWRLDFEIGRIPSADVEPESTVEELKKRIEELEGRIAVENALIKQTRYIVDLNKVLFPKDGSNDTPDNPV